MTLWQDGTRVPLGPRHSYDTNIAQVRDASVVDIMDKRKRDHEYAEIARTKKLVYPKPYIPGLDGKGIIVCAPIAYMCTAKMMTTHIVYLRRVPNGQAPRVWGGAGILLALRPCGHHDLPPEPLVAVAVLVATAVVAVPEEEASAFSCMALYSCHALAILVLNTAVNSVGDIFATCSFHSNPISTHCRNE
jgi:hypothetical protein